MWISFNEKAINTDHYEIIEHTNVSIDFKKDKKMVCNTPTYTKESFDVSDNKKVVIDVYNSILDALYRGQNYFSINNRLDTIKRNTGLV